MGRMGSCFQKKSTRGTKTTQRDIDLIKARLLRAQKEYEAWITARKPS